MNHCNCDGKCMSNRLENIDEESPASWLPFPVPRPETPIEPMEFLARSWSLSALELSKALADSCNQSKGIHSAPPCSQELEMQDRSSIPISSAAKVPPETNQQLIHLVPATAESPSDGPPISPKEREEIKEWLLLQQAVDPEFLLKQRLIGHGLYKSVVRGKTVGRWLKDQKERKKEENRTQNAQLHAAVSVAAVAAVVAAVTATTATAPDPLAARETAHSKTLAAAASAAALVASHCVEMAEDMGADRDQMLTTISSAINVQTSGDIMTLTAGAATALRGATALRARLLKGSRPAVLCPSDSSIELAGENEKTMTSYALNFVSAGGDLLKRTRKGVLHWKQVSIYTNSNLEVLVKMKSKHMVGTFVKKKKSVVSDVCCNVPGWPGRADDGEKRAYFGIRTPERLIQFECKTEREKKMWVEGIRQMLHCHANKNSAVFCS
ncbi:VAN3-binding protein-like [Aristolochia californica]|uniref:VAN3-binding protein-like n=1 Tax=Aristolochia californica TaxID=171875 RepID=UPI0035DFE9D5